MLRGGTIILIRKFPGKFEAEATNLSTVRIILVGKLGVALTGGHTYY